MDMSSSSSDSTMMMMTPYFHFAGGDSLLFKTLTPSSKGAIAGAAIFLFFLAMLERLFASYRSYLEVSWSEKAKAIEIARLQGVKEKSANGNASAQDLAAMRSIPPFIPAHDITRGAVFGFEALLRYALMLAVMTFQAAYFISIVAGLAVGEIAFGRLWNTFYAHVH